MTRQWALLTAAVFVVASGVGLAAAGPFGAVASSLVVWFGVLLAVRAGLPDREPPVVGRAAADHRSSAFPSYRDVELRLWAMRSVRLYDHSLRPRLGRQAGLLLWARAGIDMERSPDAARTLLGEELWSLVDPHVAPSYDDKTAGPSLTRLDDLARRLAEL